MKRLIVMAIVTVLGLILHAVAGEKKYGKNLTVKEPTVLSMILSNPMKFTGKRVLVVGEITDVCQNKGCWIKVVDDSKTEPVQVKVEDKVIVFPKDGKGKKVKVEGTVSVTMLSREELVKKAQHEAEEQGKLKEFDPSAITGPRTVVRIEGEGAVIQE